jgi:hypothetical protein
MYSIKNDQLAITILDPVADQERFGTRYCTGSYIFQIEDAQRGPLLSGPTYPDSFNVFDGQGIPDAFNLSPLREHGTTDAKALIIGIGLCDLEANKVDQFCTWHVEQDDVSIHMRTEQTLGKYALVLEREIALHGRTLHSAIRLANVGRRPIPLRWFPHPFFPQLADGDELCRCNFPVRFPANDGFAMTENNFIARKNWPNWEKGYYQTLDHEAATPLVIFQKHPKLGLVAATCSYIPAFFPIWGNANTFSWEPFLEHSVAGGQELSWHIDYQF